MVHLLLREPLKPEEYITSQQTRSLYSRWSKSYRDCKLKDPNIRDISEEIYEHVKLDHSEEYQLNLQDTVNKICKSWNKNDWVAVTYDNKSYPGVISEDVKYLEERT